MSQQYYILQIFHGKPKGVVLTHKNGEEYIKNISEFLGYSNNDHEVITFLCLIVWFKPCIM